MIVILIDQNTFFFFFFSFFCIFSASFFITISNINIYSTLNFFLNIVFIVFYPYFEGEREMREK
jgi:hypothetical protein